MKPRERCTCCKLCCGIITPLVLLKVKKFPKNIRSDDVIHVVKLWLCCSFGMKLRPTHLHCCFFISYYISTSHGRANTFIIFCSTNKAVHWGAVLTPHNDPLSESHCSYTQDNYSTLRLERGNYRERCSGKVAIEEKRGIRTGELWLYCLLREVVKQRTPITAGCGMKDVMCRYEDSEALLTR